MIPPVHLANGVVVVAPMIVVVAGERLQIATQPLQVLDGLLVIGSAVLGHKDILPEPGRLAHLLVLGASAGAQT